MIWRISFHISLAFCLLKLVQLNCCSGKIEENHIVFRSANSVELDCRLFKNLFGPGLIHAVIETNTCISAWKLGVGLFLHITQSSNLKCLESDHYHYIIFFNF